MEMSGQLQAPAALPAENDPETHWIGGRWAPEGIWRFLGKRISVAYACVRTPDRSGNSWSSGKYKRQLNIKPPGTYFCWAMWKFVAYWWEDSNWLSHFDWVSAWQHLLQIGREGVLWRKIKRETGREDHWRTGQWMQYRPYLQLVQQHWVSFECCEEGNFCSEPQTQNQQAGACGRWVCTCVTVLVKENCRLNCPTALSHLKKAYVCHLQHLRQ